MCGAGKCCPEPAPFTCDVSIVFLEFMGFHPLAPVLIDVDLMIIGAKGDLGTIPVPGMTGDWLQ